MRNTPEKNCAVIVASNVGVDEAFEGCDEVEAKMIDQYYFNPPAQDFIAPSGVRDDGALRKIDISRNP